MKFCHKVCKNYNKIPRKPQKPIKIYKKPQNCLKSFEYFSKVPQID